MPLIILRITRITDMSTSWLRQSKRTLNGFTIYVLLSHDVVIKIIVTRHGVKDILRRSTTHHPDPNRQTDSFVMSDVMKRALGPMMNS